MSSVGANAERILIRLKALESARAPFERLWDEVGMYVLPQGREFKSTGVRRTENIYDSTPTRAGHRLASALNAMLTPRNSRWLRGMRKVGHDDDMDVIEWTSGVAKVIHERFNLSNFHIRAHEMYLDYGTIGTPVMYFDEEFWFDTVSIWECFIDEDERGDVDTLFRKFKLSARNAEQKFGAEALSEDIKKCLDKAPEKEFEFLHAVFPRNDMKMTTGEEKFPYSSVWLELGTKNIVKEWGFWEFPFLVPRWMKYTGEKYGRTPAIEAMADIKNLHSMGRANLRAARQITDPPLDMEENTYLNPIRTSAGAINVRVTGSNPLTPLYPVTQLPVSLEIQNQIRKAVNESFYYQQLSLIDNDRMTATEVMQRTEENMRILGPTYDRLEREFLVPLVRRAYGIVSRAGDIPPPPPQLRGEPFTYESPLARAQRLNELSAINQGLMVAAPLMQVKPDVIDVVDLDGVMRQVFVLCGVDPEVILNQEVVAQIREARQQQQAEMQAAAMAEQLAKAGKDASQADPSSGLLPSIGALLGGGSE